MTEATHARCARGAGRPGARGPQSHHCFPQISADLH